MGDLIDLNEYRAKRRQEEQSIKSERELAIEEIITLLEDFFERNPVEIGPIHSGYDWLDPNYNPSIVKIVTIKRDENDDESEE